MLFSSPDDQERIRTAPFPRDWLDYLESNVAHYQFLSHWEKEILRGDLRVFMADKYWEGCAGLTITDEIRVTISAQACILTLCLPDSSYSNVRSLFVYPAAYGVRTRPGGSGKEPLQMRLGEAWQTGPVVLSWEHARSGGRDPRDGLNVVYHEFAHKLDMLDGAVDGFPRLYDDELYERWHAVMNEEWEYLRSRARSGRPTLLRRYGATHAGELFAVATEAFFEKPLQMRRRHERLYLLLKEYFRQDPASRMEPASLREV